MFLHGGLLHLAGNMLDLWIFGNNVEDAMGHVMAYIDPVSQVPTVGASGAISGVLAAYVLLYPRARVTVIVPLGIILYPFAITAIWVIGFWFLVQLISVGLNPSQPGMAWWAHVVGFAVGLVLTPVLKSRGWLLFGQVSRSSGNT